MARDFEVQASKVPEVTLGFWIIKILATTLGETAGDTVTMTWLKADVMVNSGYLVGSAIFLSALIVLVVIQIVAKKFHPFLYWATIVASTTFGTTMADFADRSLGIGYTGGSLLLFTCLMVVLALWYWSEGTISVNTVSTPRVEAFYWAAITFSQTLGTALGDWIADTGGLGYEGGALVFAAGLAVTAALYYWTDVSRVRAVLGGVHSDAATGRNFGRFPRQAARTMAGLALSRSNCLRSHCSDHDRLYCRASAKSGQPSCREQGVGGAIECPLWVISGHRAADQRCPLCPRKQTCSAAKSA